MQESKAPIWEQAPMMRLLAALVIGIILYDAFTLQYIDARIVLLGLASAFAPYIIISFKNKRGITTAILGFVCIIILGFSLCYFKDSSQRSDFIGKHLSNEKYTLAAISAEPLTKNKTTKYEVSILKSIDSNQIKESVGKAFLYVFKNGKEQKLSLGDTLVLPSNWQPINNSGNPFEMNYQKYCNRKRIYFQQFIAPEKIIVYAIKNSNSYSLIERAHRHGINSINHNIKDSSTNALLKAMLLGDERDIDPNMREAYSDTGIIHIVSISGAHVGILFAAIGTLFALIKSKKKKWIQLLVSLSIVWFYVLISGASTPALRAAVMFSILAIGTASQQQTNPLNQLLTAAFVLLLFNPMWLFTIGFQLSFIAVLSLIIFYEPVHSILPPLQFKEKSKAAQYVNYGSNFLINALAASIAAEILVAPLVAFYFHSFPPMFLVANVVASLAMTAVLIMGMLLIILAQIATLAQFLAFLIVYISQIFHQFIGWLQQFNSEALKTIQLSTIALVLLYIFIVAIAHFWLQKNKKSLWVGLSVMFLFSVLHLYNSWQIGQQNGLIVYNQSGDTQIEHFWGNNFCALNASGDEGFAQKNAHIGLHLKNKISQKSNYIYLIKNQKVLVVHNTELLPKAFPTDILIMATSPKTVDVQSLQKIFSPKKIVIANNQKPYQVKDWEAQCASLNIALHNTKKDGAFILQ